MKKLIMLFLFLFSISSVLAVCSPYERFGLFDTPNNYTLGGEVYNVSIKESKGTLNSFDVTINGVTYPSKHYNTSFDTGIGEKVYLGKPYAASSVFYTSIDFCMKKIDSLAGEQESSSPQTFSEARNMNSFLIGVVVVLILIIFCLLLRKKK